jgi:Protein of unknown function (DUF2975)
MAPVSLPWRGVAGLRGCRGEHGAICASQPHMSMSSGDWPVHGASYAPRAGATVTINGTVQACVQHPGLGQRFLKTLTSLPSMVVWLGVLFLLWRLVRTAEQSGPFTEPMARLLRFTGWFIIAGSIAASAAQGAATDALLSMMLQGQNSFADAVPLPGAVVVPVLAGVVALTFARIVRVGSRMAEDLQGTV